MNIGKLISGAGIIGDIGQGGLFKIASERKLFDYTVVSSEHAAEHTTCNHECRYNICAH